MALSVIDGYNCCIFAYGQTGSGKTFTMEGTKENGQFGISQRFIEKVFNLLQDKAEQHQGKALNNEEDESPAPFEYSIEVSELEIYNDEGEFQTLINVLICAIRIFFPSQNSFFFFSLIQYMIYLTQDFRAPTLEHQERNRWISVTALTVRLKSLA